MLLELRISFVLVNFSFSRPMCCQTAWCQNNKSQLIDFLLKLKMKKKIQGDTSYF